jgi:NAD(P)-dependent dehydrogenase (short-subunit alcohol dehydrogenase family)
MTKIALVTGANRGLGRNIAVSIARHGRDVIVTYRGNASQAREVVAEIEALGRKAVALQLDLGVVASFAAFAETLRAALKETWGRDSFDYLINNAGHGEFAMIGDTTEAQFDGLFDVHVKGIFFLV